MVYACNKRSRAPWSCGTGKGAGQDTFTRTRTFITNRGTFFPIFREEGFFCVFSRSGEEHSERKSSILPDRPSIDPLMIR